MHVRYYCHFDKLTGFGRAARDYIAALVKAGADVDIWPFDGAGQVDPAERPLHGHLEPFVRRRRLEETPDVAVLHAPVAHIGDLREQIVQNYGPTERAAIRWVAVTAWEFDEPPAWLLERLSPVRFSEVFVPSRAVASAFADAGVLSTVVPHTFDPEVWNPAEVEAEPKSDLYTFYTVGAWNARKNPLGVLKAYLHAFTADDPVRLVMAGGAVDRVGVQEVLGASGLLQSRQPRVEIHTEPLTADELLALHALGDCYVTATRGEGFGLGAFEATIMGSALIAPATGGLVDFADLAAAVTFVPTMPEPVFPELRKELQFVEGKRAHALVRDVPKDVDAKFTWPDPSILAISQAMQNAVEARLPTDNDLKLWMCGPRDTLVQRFGDSAVAELFLSNL